MKFATKALSSLLAVTSAVFPIEAKPLESCSSQKKCMSWTVTEVEEAKCSSSFKCEYEICFTLNFGLPGCDKSGSISHTCQKDNLLCAEPTGFGSAIETLGLQTGWTECQTVIPGEKAQFLLKDGGGCSDSATLDDGITGECEPRPGEVQSCTGNGVGKECVWTIQAPSNCPSHGGMNGDPHIRLWDSKRFSYHGECDLVMLHSDEYDSGRGLDLHIRTTIQKFYSFVESMALRIGDRVLEISNRNYYLDGNMVSDLPSHIYDNPITERVEGNNKIIRIGLNNHDYIEVRIYKVFLSINVAGREANFGNSIGLLGDFYTGAMMARDGETIIALGDEYGAEWQVQEDEPNLFHSDRAPQLPRETCRMPSESAARGLRKSSGMRKAAEEACKNKPADAFDFCVFDVLATGDVGMAGAW